MGYRSFQVSKKKNKIRNIAEKFDFLSQSAGIVTPGIFTPEINAEGFVALAYGNLGHEGIFPCWAVAGLIGRLVGFRSQTGSQQKAGEKNERVHISTIP
jgi:hypothetical protein